MKILRTFAFLALGVSLSACAAVDTVTRNAPFEAVSATPATRVVVPTPSEIVPEAVLSAPFRIEAVVVNVPRSLKVSEANRYLPAGDIVWRGDPVGDRYEQVKAIFEAAMLTGAQKIDGAQPVDLLINVKRFHALTEKARYTTGGVHNIVFDLALADPETGEIIVPWREIRADLEAFGGAKAIEADRVGQTQKVRITDHLAIVMQQEITTAEGHQNAKLGLIQMMNQI
ncbi:hypothetical protein OAN15_00170 [bacterium]|nr:hypothetical protein [bacterium]